MKIYVASSWRNEEQQHVVKALREAGHEVYDFKDPQTSKAFHWSQVDPAWRDWTPDEYIKALSHPVAQSGFSSDFRAMYAADAVVGVQPFGRSASMEMGWMAGQGKLSILLVRPGEPELMVGMFDRLCTTIEEVIDYLEDVTLRPLDPEANSL